MPEENFPDFSRELKHLVRWLRDALISLRELCVLAIALVIVLSEKLLAILREWKQSRVDRPLPQPQNAFKRTNPLERDQDKPMPDNSDKELKRIKKIVISDKSDLESESPRKSFSVGSFAYQIFAGISTLALVIGVGKLGPISQWANTQNECIERSESIDGTKNDDLPVKVMICNGGHE